jgi:hypothetical protein
LIFWNGKIVLIRGKKRGGKEERRTGIEEGYVGEDEINLSPR